MPPADRRAALRDAFRDLKQAAAALPALVEAFGEHLREQEDAFDASRLDADAREQRARTEADRVEQAHAAALVRATDAADESGRVAVEMERDLDEARARLAEHTARSEAALAAEQSESVRLRDRIARLSAEVERLMAERAAVPLAARPSRAKSTEPAASARTPKPAAPKPARKQAGPKEPAPDIDTVPPRPASAAPVAPPEAALPESRPAPAGPSPPEMAAAPVPAETVLADVFRAWCRAARPVVGRVEFFTEHVRQAIPGAFVSAVYRDANSQAQPVTFRARGGSSPVEYWLVSHAGRHALLPQPLGAQQFRELAPCMDGAATPAALREVEPAEVRPVGDQFELVRAGRVA